MAAGDEKHCRKWRYTWESQSHIPTLRLLLFAKNANPSLQCLNLKVQLFPSQSLVAVSWFEPAQVSLRVPIPRVLVDFESPVSFRALDDHIEVKLLLLLPVDHPVVSSFDSVMNLSDDPVNALPDVSEPLVMGSDVKNLSSRAAVHFYCGSCSFKLTRNPLRSFVEMPSVNWREVADNWFGACCCSFGGISEKLVIKYANSYTCAPGVCLLSSTSITLCKDDLIEYNFPERGGEECNSKSDKFEEGINKAAINSEISMERSSTCSEIGKTIYNSDESSRFADSQNEKLNVNLGHEVGEEKSNHDDFSRSYLDSHVPADVAMASSCCAHMTSSVHILENEDWQHQCCENARKEHKDTTAMEILASQKSFLNGFLEDVFMARSSNLSEDIDWCEFTCPQCKSVLGAYPSCKGEAPVDGGVRLFKCNISTCLPVRGSGDLFRQYTMGKMFANKLVECANDESSFRFAVIDLKAKSPALQIILINPDTWSISGDCFITEDSEVPKLQLQPVIKLLFSECSTATELQLRMTEEWITNNSAESIFMLTYQIKELVASMMSGRDAYPPSYASIQGLCLSSMQR
ncbi:uncharacterized protein LOC114761954 [Neltuma alba]|uniref:uncharacterized protein LOC114737561 n=1 Tax=Neltuma alba TaxID=207710 RepID=UPI0010A3071A|nr:uncharacterized protein LOC114737561 [Prosopis alba]XP_028807223.1 uncharacterized protein LOC114761941 [Prosopis alba]XP_028807233.1 uncharacterized protein LOC114761954 [Prosopis alba]